MTASDLQAAAERIMADRDFARRVYDAPEGSPPIEYDLDPAEWQAVQRALAADVEASTDEVAGFSDPFSLNINFANVGGLTPPADATKKVKFSDFSFTHHVDKASP